MHALADSTLFTRSTGLSTRGPVYLLFGLIIFLSVSLAGQTVPLPAARDRVGVIDETQFVSLKGHVHPLAQARFDRGSVEDGLVLEHLILLLRRSPEQDAAVAVLVDQLHNQNSPNFHQWLTPEDFGRHFGPSDSDLAQLTNWLRSKGFTIDDVPPGATHIVISGTAGQLRAAFHTELHHLNVNGQEHIAVLSEPQIPAALAPVVAGFRQLHDWKAKPLYHLGGVFQRDAQTGAWQKVSGPQAAPEFDISNNSYYAVAPQDWYTIYNAQPLYQAGITGAGVTIAVLEETEVVHQADVTSFWSQFGVNSSQDRVSWLYGPGHGCTISA